MTNDLPPIFAIDVADDEGSLTTLAEHRGNVLLIVNTASY